MIKIAVCDDDKNILKHISDMLNKHYAGEIQIKLYTEADSLLADWELAEGAKADIVIMDIKLTHLDGISAAKRLQERYRTVKIIFVTGYLEYATEIFRAEPVYFLSKPVEEMKLFEAVDRAIDKLQKERSQIITCQSKGKIMQFQVNEISYIESNKRSLFIHEGRNATIVNMKLNDLESKLPEFFLRCHQSFLVNMNYIKSFSGQEIELFDGTVIQASRPKAVTARETFLRFLGDTV